MIEAAKYSLLVFGLIVLLGGYFGARIAKSRKSLIASAISFGLLVICFFISLANIKLGFGIALFVIGILDIVFIIRLTKTKKFMPSGLLLILCGLEQGLLSCLFFCD